MVAHEGILPQAPTAAFSCSANLVEADPHQSRGLAQRCRNMANAYSAMMSWALRIPGGHETTRAEGKAVAAVGVTDGHDGAGHTLALGDNQLEACICVFHNRSEEHT